MAEKNQNKLKGAKKTDRKTEQANPTGHRIPDPHRLPSPPSLLPEPDQIHAAVSSYGSSPFPTAARGLLLRQLTAICHHGVGRGRKKRPAPVSEDAGKKGLGGGSGGGGVPQLGWWRRRRLLRCSWRGRCFNFEAFVLHFFHSFELSSLAVVEHNQSYFLKKNIISPFSFYCETKIVLYNEKGIALAMVPLKNINWSVCCIIGSTITHLEITLHVFRCQMQHLSRSRKRTTIA